MYILLIADKKNLLIFDRNKLFFTLGHADMLTIKQVFLKEGITNGLVFYYYPKFICLSLKIFSKNIVICLQSVLIYIEEGLFLLLHLFVFVRCVIANDIWNKCYRWLGVLFVQHMELMSHFKQFHLLNLNLIQNLVWKGLWIVS